jgi:hypothetical protein
MRLCPGCLLALWDPLRKPRAVNRKQRLPELTPSTFSKLISTALNPPHEYLIIRCQNPKIGFTRSVMGEIWTQSSKRSMVGEFRSYGTFLPVQRAQK